MIVPISTLPGFRLAMKRARQMVRAPELVWRELGSMRIDPRKPVTAKLIASVAAGIVDNERGAPWISRRQARRARSFLMRVWASHERHEARAARRAGDAR